MKFKPVQIELYSDRYNIYDTGEVYSVISKKFLKKRIRNGYYSVYLYKDKNNSVTIATHRLVAQVFLKNPNNYKIVNHINGNKLDNNFTNLEWTTQKHNISHALQNNMIKPSTRSVIKFDLNDNQIEKYDSVKDAAHSIGLTRHSIIRVCKGKNITAGGFKWKYEISDINIDLTIFKKIENMKYMVSNNGDIYSIVNKILLKPMKNDNGYTYVTICNKGNKKRNYYVHQLVAMTYIENSQNKKFVNHINRIKNDNRVINLEWVTHSENVQHYYKTK